MSFFDYVKDEALILYNNAISIKELVVFLHKNKQITTLSLKSCQIGDEDVKELAELSNLTSLNLSGNRIGARGAEALANGNLINLTSLNLSGNRIGARGAEALANSNLINLTSLNLLGNGITVSDNGNFVDFTSCNAGNSIESGKGVLAKLRHRAEIMKKSQKIPNVQISVQSNESQQMNAEKAGNDDVAASVSSNDNHVSSDDKRKQDSIQSAECVEQMRDGQVSRNQDNSQLAGNQKKQLGLEGEKLIAGEVNNPAILSTANNSNPNEGIETSTLGQDNNTQSNNNNSKDYNQLFELLNTIEGDSDVDESNVTETIQKELKEKNLDIYQKWQGNQFDINYTFANQSTLLCIAAGGGFLEVTKLLIKKGADVNKTGLYGYTPLHCAIGGGFIEVVHVLMEEGADVNAVEESKRTPLHNASYYGHVEIVKALLYKGADLELKDRHEFTPLDYAIDCKHTDTIDILKKAELALKMKRRLSERKNNIASSSTSPGTNSDDISGFSDDTDFSYTTETHEPEAMTQDLGVANQKVSQLEQAVAAKNQELEGMKYQLREKTRDLGVANQKVSQLEQAVAAKNQELEAMTQGLGVANQKILQLEQECATKNQELEAMTQGLGVANQKVSQLEQAVAAKNQEFAEVIYQFREKERALDQRTSQLEQEWGSAQRELAAKTKEYESAQARSKELNGKNEKFLRVSTHSKRQGKCASVFFVLSCAFTVGASLTIPYSATCVTLAIAASIFLAVGCYCSYKANTALNNVEVDQVAKGANPVIV